MSDLRAQSQQIKYEVTAASIALTQLEQEAQKEIGERLCYLQTILRSSTLAIEGILHKNKRRLFSLAMLQTRSQKAVQLKRSLDDLIQLFEIASETAAECLELSEHYHLKSKDFPRYHLDPVRKSVQALRSNISDARDRARCDLAETNRQVAIKRSRLENVMRDIQNNETQIMRNEQKALQNRDEVSRMEMKQRGLENDRATKKREAAQLRKEAESRRTSGILVGIFTLGIGVLYTAIQFDRARSIEYDAVCADRQSNDIFSKLITLRSLSSQLQSDINNLQSERQRLESSTHQLNNDLSNHNTRSSYLQTQEQNLNLQIQDTQGLLIDTTKLDTLIDNVCQSAKALQRHLMQTKHRIDGLHAAVEDQRDRTLVVNKFKNQLSMTKEGRAKLMAMLVGTALNTQKVLENVNESEI